MLETIFSWLLSAIAAIAQVVVNQFLEMIALDLDKFLQYFPAAADLYIILRGVAMGFVLGFGIFAILRFLASPLTKVTETPAIVLTRVFIAACMVFMGGHILELVVDLFKGPFSVLAFTDFTDYGIDDFFITIGDNVEGFFTEGSGALSLSAGTMTSAVLLLSLIIVIMLGVNLFKLMLELVQRYLMVGILVYTGPLGWCTLASVSTMGIFSKWVNMVISQCLMMLLSAWSVKMLFSILIEGHGTSFFFKCIFALAFCQLAQKFDSYIQQLGLNPAITGANLLDEMFATAKSVSAIRREGKGGKAGTSWKDGTGGAGDVLGSTLGVKGGSALLSGLRGYRKEKAAAMAQGRSKEDAAKQARQQFKTNYVGHQLDSVPIPVSNAAQKAWGKITKNPVTSDSLRKNGESSFERDVRLTETAARNDNTKPYENMTYAMKQYAHERYGDSEIGFDGNSLDLTEETNAQGLYINEKGFMSVDGDESMTEQMEYMMANQALTQRQVNVFANTICGDKGSVEMGERMVESAMLGRNRVYRDQLIASTHIVGGINNGDDAPSGFVDSIERTAMGHPSLDSHPTHGKLEFDSAESGWYHKPVLDEGGTKTGYESYYFTRDKEFGSYSFSRMSARDSSFSNSDGEGFGFDGTSESLNAYSVSRGFHVDNKVISSDIETEPLSSAPVSEIVQNQRLTNSQAEIVSNTIFGSAGEEGFERVVNDSFGSLNDRHSNQFAAAYNVGLGMDEDSIPYEFKRSMEITAAGIPFNDADPMRGKIEFDSASSGWYHAPATDSNGSKEGYNSYYFSRKQGRNGKPEYSFERFEGKDFKFKKPQK